MNGRLDSLQAAILFERLRIFPQELKKRQLVAMRYFQGVGGIATPTLPVSEALANCVLSLPMHPYLETDVQVILFTLFIRLPRA